MIRLDHYSDRFLKQIKNVSKSNLVLFCHINYSLMKTNALAQMEMESPQLKQLIFLALKERPKEAPFRVRKIVGAARTCNVQLE
jgi:hypothetical protein